MLVSSVVSTSPIIPRSTRLTSDVASVVAADSALRSSRH
jgi:hypothetical protein